MNIPTTATTLTAIEAAEHAGIDLSLIDENLRLSYEQRALKHDSALQLVLQVEAALQIVGCTTLKQICSS
jgi:pheromone shutdown protein TraB